LAIPREIKSTILEGYQSKLSKAEVVVWAQYKGLTVAQTQDLRRRLRAVNAEAVVVKNSLMRIALESAQMDYDHDLMSGASMVTFVNGEIPPAIKTLSDFSRERDTAFVLKGGLLDGKLVSLEQVKDLINLPPRDVMLARVVGTIQAPISGFVNVLAGVLRGLPNVLNAYSAKLEEGSTS